MDFARLPVLNKVKHSSTVYPTQPQIDPIEKIDRLNCPTWQKLELLQAVIDTTKGTYKPKEHQKPGWQPSR